MAIDIGKLIESMKGVSAASPVLAESLKKAENFLRTCEPGDFAGKSGKSYSAAPLAPDVWYLWCNMNFMQKFYAYNDPPINGDTFDYTNYITNRLQFLSSLPGIKPVKTVRNLAQFVGTNDPKAVFWNMRTVWSNKGVYWINLLAFELWTAGLGPQYGSTGPKGQDLNQYVGYITFPVGQLGIMEVISVMQETEITGSKLLGAKVITPMPQDASDSVASSSPTMFPEMALAGKNYCFGDHIIESGYVLADEDVELFSTNMTQYGYGEDVNPKKWLRYWINKDDKFPVPGEFLGILCRPVACPPHLWWFQDSNPLLYAGNWVEANNVTTGIISGVTLEAGRDDGGAGNQYDIKIQGVEVTLEASDFLLYSIGDRVAVVKMDTIGVSADKSFTWRVQKAFIKADEFDYKDNYIIVPISFYKESA